METFASVLKEFVHSPVEVLAAIVVIFSPMFKTVRLFWSNLWVRLRSKSIVPSETFRIVQNIQQSFWSLGSANGTPQVQVSFRGHVTNISGDTNRVLRAEILKPAAYADLVLISNNNDGRRPQILAPRESADLSATFFVKQVATQKGKPLKVSLIFIDQYANRHKLKNCIFQSV